MINFNKKNILVVVAHPDDELLGLGGTLAYLAENSSVNIRVVILGEGITSRSDSRDAKSWEKQLKKHRKNIEDAKKILGYHQLSCYQLPDNRFDDLNLLDIVKIIEKEIVEFQPDILFTHHGGDLNIDHQKTFEAVMVACRPVNQDKPKAILTFETPSSSEWQSNIDPRLFRPNFFFELDKKHIETKSLAMECYEYEKRVFPHPRSPKALLILAQNRGISVGKEYVEAFCIIKLYS